MQHLGRLVGLGREEAGVFEHDVSEFPEQVVHEY